MTLSFFRDSDRLVVGTVKVFRGAQRGFVVLLLMTAAALLFIEVLLRYVFHAPLMGIEEVIVFLSIWFYFIGGVNASAERRHITIGVIDEVIKQKRPIFMIKIIAAVITLILAIWLLAWGYDYLCWVITREEMSPSLSWPLIIAYSAIPVGLLFIFTYTLVEFLDTVPKFFRELR